MCDLRAARYYVNYFLFDWYAFAVRETPVSASDSVLLPCIVLWNPNGSIYSIVFALSCLRGALVHLGL